MLLNQQLTGGGCNSMEGKAGELARPPPTGLSIAHSATSRQRREVVFNATYRQLSVFGDCGAGQGSALAVAELFVPVLNLGELGTAGFRLPGTPVC